MIGAAMGAEHVRVFDFTARSDSEAVRVAKTLRDPATMVHNDYTSRSARQRVRDILGADADRLLERRFAIVNLWRSMRGDVETTPIALCDARSIRESSMVAVERRAKDRIGEVYWVTYDENHRWFYYPDLTYEEGLLIKTYDSDDSRACYAPHCAFQNPTARPDAKPRESIEARAFVFF